MMKYACDKLAVIGAFSMLSAFAAFADAAAIKPLDPDNDGTIDLVEAQAGATTVFLALDSDKDGTLDAKELAGRVDTAGLNAVDSDTDGTLDTNDYAKLVEAKFTAADPDNDGTINDKELSSSAGAALWKLIQLSRQTN